MDTDSSSSGSPEGAKYFLERLAPRERRALFSKLSQSKQVAALSLAWSGKAEGLPECLRGRYKADLKRRHNQKKQFEELLAKDEAETFCNLTPLFAGLAPRMRVYCKIDGQTHEDGAHQLGHSDDEEFADLHYQVRLEIKFDGETVARFKHRDTWKAYTHDSSSVEFLHDKTQEHERAITVGDGVPFTAHDWRKAIRTFLRSETEYYAIGRRLGTSWLSTDDDETVVHLSSSSSSDGRDPEAARPRKRRRGALE